MLSRNRYKYKILTYRRRTASQKNYIKYSLITEKELYETILTNVKDRNGNYLPIEKRMQESIKNSFGKSDFDFEEVKRSSKWKSFKERAKIVKSENFYIAFYGISSHAVHGSWQDLLFNNLKELEDGFELNLEWNKPRPQIMDCAIFFNFDIIKIFCRKELTDNVDSIKILKKCDVLHSYHSYLLQSHEKWMLKIKN